MHPCPEKAMSDGAQSLNFAQFRSMMQELKPLPRHLEGDARSKRNIAAKAAVCP
jgi:3-deoxy-D-manno-octulosonic acid (KDO) 8-phosphate synthase